MLLARWVFSVLPRAASVPWLGAHLTESSPPSFWEKQLGFTSASCVASCEQLPKWSGELIRQTAASGSVSLKVSLEEWGGSRPFLWGPLTVQRALRVYAQSWDCT